MSDLQIGDILYTFKKGNLFSRLINYLSRFARKNKPTTPKISHALIYFGSGLICESSFGGVVIHAIDKYTLSGHYIVEAQRYMETGLTTAQQVALIAYCQKTVGVIKYGWAQLFIMLLKKLFGAIPFGDFSKNQMVCSEFVANAYEYIGISIVEGMKPYEVSPIDLYESPVMKDVE